jgi:hypothetical protein
LRGGEEGLDHVLQFLVEVFLVKFEDHFVIFFYFSRSSIKVPRRLIQLLGPSGLFHVKKRHGTFNYKKLSPKSNYFTFNQVYMKM